MSSDCSVGLIATGLTGAAPRAGGPARAAGDSHSATWQAAGCSGGAWAGREGGTFSECVDANVPHP
jgi:hypothetical protein